MKEYQILKELVKFNTIKDKDNKNILNYIENILKEKGFTVQYKSKLLIMSYGKNPTFGFLGHTDTVECIDGWNSNPFILTDKRDKLYGLGSCDMKGGIAAILDAINDIDLDQVKNGIKLYFTYDEEINFSGINELLKNNEKFPDFMVFGEPTNNEIVIGSKGLLQFDLSFKGKTTHASTPDKGKSANLNAIHFLNELENFYLKNIKKDINMNYEIPYTTMNIGLLNGGSSQNSIPAKCYASLDFRLIDSNHSKLILDEIKKLCKKYDSEYKITINIEPFINDVNLQNDGKTSNFITEASFINCKNKIILGLGPITAHEIDEHIDKKSYDLLINQYKTLIKKFA